MIYITYGKAIMYIYRTANRISDTFYVREFLDKLIEGTVWFKIKKSINYPILDTTIKPITTLIKNQLNDDFR